MKVPRWGDAELDRESSFQLGNFCVNEPRPMKVVVIGAGYSVLPNTKYPCNIRSISYRQKIQNLDLTIYESNAGVGGTWFANKYPGLACDVPSHVYQLTFAEKTDWSAFYAPGPEIRGYLESVVDKFKLLPYIKLEHRVVRAEYSEPKGKWRLTIRRKRSALVDQGGKWDWAVDFEEFEDTADVVFSGAGALSRWSWPDIAGLDSFGGKLIHSADWDTGEGSGAGWEETVKSWGDKNVAVIGVGSTALQIVPALQPKVKHLVNYVRGQTWLAAPMLKERLLQLSGGKEVTNYFFTPEDKKSFEDPEYYKTFRRDIESHLNAGHGLTIRNSEMQIGARAQFKEDMVCRLEKKPWIADYLVPDFAVGCRRITPGPGYLEALCEENVDFVPTPIHRITPTGIETIDGDTQDLDIIICATGFETSYKMPFPVIGRKGVTLNEKYDPHPRTYLSVAVDGFPNWFQGLGPNGCLGAGSLLLLIERQVDYAVAATLKLQRERLKSIEVKKEAVDDFDEYLESVFSEQCRTWYKMGKEDGRVVALWPGSALHATHALANPRWEDFNFEPLNGSANRFHWLGDGHSVADKDSKADTDRSLAYLEAWYLKNENIDFPPGRLQQPRNLKGSPISTMPSAVESTPLNPTTVDRNGLKHDQFQLGDFCVDQPRRMKVAAIGAGYSGIMAGIRFRQKVQNLDLTIYESNAGVGGTWLVNKYPGLACDIPSHAYQLLYEEKKDWSAFYSPGPEILGYLEGVVDKYKLQPYIKLQHRVMRAEYSEPEGKWHLTIRKRRVPPTDKNEKWDWDTDFEEFEDVVDVVFAGLGALNRWTWPDIKGLETFKGKLIHSADWDTGEGAGGGWEDTVKSWGDKNVAVIGVGSTALQIVPALQPKVKHLVNYVRGKTWITASILKERLVEMAGGKDVPNYHFTEEDRESFKDPEYYQQFRREIESYLNSAHAMTIRNSPMQTEVRAAFRVDMLKKLEKKPWIADHLMPNFPVCCRRLTPGPGYLEALCEDNVDFVPTPIQEVTPTGILNRRCVMTGFDTSYKLFFPVVGRNGVLLNEKYDPYPRTYLSVAVDGFPNWFQSLGPNGGLGAGSLLILMQSQVNYAVEATLKLQRERLKSMEVKKEAVDDFDEYLETVFSDKCRSWYKLGKEEGRVVALWPGSVLHSTHALAHPRWEDYHLEPMDGVRNRFHWLGDGDSLADKDPLGDSKSSHSFRGSTCSKDALRGLVS
ncbi:FAD/NAD-binding domain-containing protein [Infundibulicybe gibba]|nr:FAD/NAD-binding domain-containing protein [Infundibulicybe gibba]